MKDDADRYSTRDPVGRARLGRRARRVLGDGAFAGAAALVGFLLLCWPFVRTPPLDDASALAFVFGVWAAFILVLAATMAVRDRGAERRSRR